MDEGKKGTVQGYVRTLGRHQWGSGPMGAMVKNSDHLEAAGQWVMMEKEVVVHKLPVHLVTDTETSQLKTHCLPRDFVDG